ncbi:MAG: hypothetical protein FWE86_00815 [Oscillospiraceae bacterium]|nr:hypothetical protein [Oscillospiraceae bacterium]
MNCYCYETDSDFVLCVENAEIEHEDIILHAWFKKDGNRYIKSYPMGSGADKSWYEKSEEKERIKCNFARLGQSMFEGIFDWKNVLSSLAQTFSDNRIEWYIFGSLCEAVRGINIKPNDVDIIVNTKDFYRVKELFPDNVVEPFVDNKGTWLVRFFGRLCLGGAIVDIVADEKMNMGNHHYEKMTWNGFEVFAEPFQTRYALEKERNRADRLKAMELFLKHTE